MVEIGKKWHNVRVIRFKAGYQLRLMAYPRESEETEYLLELGEEGGTELLTHYDYNYERVVEDCVKSAPQYMYFTYQLPCHQQPVFYKFNKAKQDKERHQEDG